MRRFKRRQPHSLPFGLFLAVVGVLLLPAVVAPRANAGRRRRYPAAKPSRSRGINALSRLRSAPTRQGSRRGDRSTSKKTNVLPFPHELLQICNSSGRGEKHVEI